MRFYSSNQERLIVPLQVQLSARPRTDASWAWFISASGSPGAIRNPSSANPHPELLEPSAFSHRAVFQNFIFRNFCLTASERVHIIRAFCKAKNPVRDCPALQDQALSGSTLIHLLRIRAGNSGYTLIFREVKMSRTWV